MISGLCCCSTFGRVSFSAFMYAMSPIPGPSAIS